jgi:hypothetical protein
MQPLVLAVQNAVPPRDMGVATSSATFFRQMGGTLGTAVFLSILFSTVGEKILAVFRAEAETAAFRAALRDPQVLADPADAAVIESLRSAGRLPAGSLDDTSFLERLDPRIARPFLEGFAGSTSLVFTVAAGVLALALAVVFFLPEEPLRTLSGLQAREEEAAETAARAATVSAPSSQMVDGDTLEEPVRPGGR